MNHVTLIWIALIAGSVVTGASLVGLLVSERALEPFSGALTVLGFASGAWAFGQITLSYSGLDAVGYALAFGLAGAAGGYALASTLLGRLALRRRIAPPPSTQPDDRGTTAVLVLSEFEPTLYSAKATAVALDDLADEGLLQASIWVLPFLFMAQKTRYRAAGGNSPGARELESIAEKLGSALSARGIGHVETASCDGERSLSTRIAAVADLGFRTIVVAEAFIADSLEIDRVKREVDALRLSERGVAVTYADPLWGSEGCAALVAERALAVAGDLQSSGVILVGQAQPEQRSRIARSFDEQETAFLNHVRMLLIDRGLPEPRVHIAWADWRSPEVTGAVRHLAALGCRQIVVLPACFPLDSITTLLDLPLSVRQARVDESVSVVTLQAWHDDPRLVEALRSKILPVLDSAEAASRSCP